MAEATGLASYEEIAESPSFCCPLPLHAELNITFQRIAVGEVVKAGVDQAFTVNGILVVIPVVRSAQADAAPGPVIAISKAYVCDLDLRTLKELVVEVGDAIDMSPVQHAVSILPRAFMIECEANSTLQAVALAEMDRSAGHIFTEIIEIDAGIDQLRLRCKRPCRIKRKALAAFDGKRVAEAVIAVHEGQIASGKAQIAVVPGSLRLRIDVKSALAIPGKRSAKAISFCTD